MKNIERSEYSDYFEYYINLNPNDTIIEGLENQLKATTDFFKNIPSEKLEYQYEVGKWTPKDILQHLIDTERVFSYRALRFARFDETPLSGYEENDFAASANANLRSIEELIEEYVIARKSTILLFKSFSDIMLESVGVASGASNSVRAIGYVITGHDIHHINVIKERYL
ncbi:DinB family protein [Flavobacterium urocaniciphilum]|uniref:DinB superfamily protein n=1 Tax=Flavobacterium urocaniciphilum TaxID=1299341 RepID=A0A1H8ZAA2_9FLAO|nr:DinB family protein [Flavobacterium urocaniciphilum]SEP61370.1 DinB superfamily protein [Flavobacterium urocaniciphilum]